MVNITMVCEICLSAVNTKTPPYTDCIIELLERIKVHYNNLKKQCSDNDLVINTLRKKNKSLEKTVASYEREQESLRVSWKNKRRRVYSGDRGSASQCSDVFENVLLDKSEDNFNNALNNEEEFGMTFAHNSPVCKEENRINKREPLESISSSMNIEFNAVVSPVKIKKEISADENSENRSPIHKTLKETEITNFFKKEPSNNCKEKRRQPSLSLNFKRTRQTSLLTNFNKDSANYDTTTNKGRIEASPTSEISVKKCNKSKQWLLRKKNSKFEKLNDSVFDTLSPWCGNSTTDPPTPQKEKLQENDSSSVVMLTPHTPDVIFLDDTCESFNIQSMDLIQNMATSSENRLQNLRRIESNRIKLIQKCVSGNLEQQINQDHELSKTRLLFEEETINDEEEFNSEYLKETLIDELALQENDFLKPQPKSPEEKLKTNIFNIDCVDCQKYIKYLGHRMSTEEIQQHIRNCTKHKNRVEVNLTPEGFWDPIIKPFDENDSRNEVLLDTRFIGKKKL